MEHKHQEFEGPLISSFKFAAKEIVAAALESAQTVVASKIKNAQVQTLRRKLNIAPLHLVWQHFNPSNHCSFLYVLLLNCFCNVWWHKYYVFYHSAICADSRVVKDIVFMSSMLPVNVAYEFRSRCRENGRSEVWHLPKCIELFTPLLLSKQKDLAIL